MSNTRSILNDTKKDYLVFDIKYRSHSILEYFKKYYTIDELEDSLSICCNQQIGIYYIEKELCTYSNIRDMLPISKNRKYKILFAIIEVDNLSNISILDEVQISCINLGIGLLISCDYSETINYIKEIVNGKKASATNFAINRLCVYLLSTIPRISEADALKLLAYKKSIRKIFTSTLDELKEVPGIGLQKATAIYCFVNSSFLNEN